MSILCSICDRSIMENPSEYQHYLSTSFKKIDKNLYIGKYYY